MTKTEKDPAPKRSYNQVLRDLCKNCEQTRMLDQKKSMHQIPTRYNTSEIPSENKNAKEVTKFTGAKAKLAVAPDVNTARTARKSFNGNTPRPTLLKSSQKIRKTSPYS